MLDTGQAGSRGNSIEPRHQAFTVYLVDRSQRGRPKYCPNFN